MNNQVVDSELSKNQKNKQVKLLRKSPKIINDGSMKLPALSIQLNENLSEMELKNGKLFTYYDKENLIRVYDDLLDSHEPVCEVKLPESGSIVDIVTNELYILVATPDSIIVHRLTENPPLVKSGIAAKSIDLDQNKIVLVSNDKIEVLEIKHDSIETVQSIDYKTAGILKKVKFVKNSLTFNVSLLTSTSLYLYNITLGNSREHLKKVIPLNDFHEWLVTSRNIIIKFDHGLYVFDFSECSEFKCVPLPSGEISARTNPDSMSDVINSCADDESMFYITRYDNNGTTGNGELRLFKINELGIITELTVLKNIKHSERYCIGKLSGRFAICVAKGQYIEVHSLSR